MGAALQCCVKLFGVMRGPRQFHFVGCRPRVLTLMGAAYVMTLVWRGRTSYIVFARMLRIATLMGATHLTFWFCVVDREGWWFRVSPLRSIMVGSSTFYDFVSLRKSRIVVSIFVYESVCSLPFPK